MTLLLTLLSACKEKIVCLEKIEKSETEVKPAPPVDGGYIEKTCEDGFELNDKCECVKQYWKAVQDGEVHNPSWEKGMP